MSDYKGEGKKNSADPVPTEPRAHAMHWILMPLRQVSGAPVRRRGSQGAEKLSNFPSAPQHVNGGVRFETEALLLPEPGFLSQSPWAPHEKYLTLKVPPALSTSVPDTTSHHSPSWGDAQGGKVRVAGSQRHTAWLQVQGVLLSARGL